MNTAPLFIGLSPNIDTKDVVRACRVLLSPWTWNTGAATRVVEQWFSSYLHTPHVVSFGSGRAALVALLSAFGVGEGDDVLIQAFTCSVVPGSVKSVGAYPVFVDCTETYTMDFDDAEKKITPKTRALIVQHTFGISADMTKATLFASKHHLILLEDCAHALGTTFHGKRVGSLGDGSFFSFGRDKVVSSVFGGLAAIGVHTGGGSHVTRLMKYHARLRYPTVFWILQQVMHPILTYCVKTSYNIYIGKVLLAVLQRFRILSRPVSDQEKRGRINPRLVCAYPNALAQLLLVQLEKFSVYTKQRTRAHERYEKIFKRGIGRENVLLRYPVQRKDRDLLLQKAKEHAVYLGDWYSHCIDPKDTDFEANGYIEGSCPRAERLAKEVVNLPTLISDHDLERVLVLFEK